MNRRFFIQAAAASVFIPHELALASGAPPQREWAGADWFFYDDRFPLARRVAEELSGSTELTPVRGDITAIWNAGLHRQCGQSTLILNGITTESFPFCLGIMLGEQTRVAKQVSRIDRDLFLWQLRSGPSISRSIRA